MTHKRQEFTVITKVGGKYRPFISVARDDVQDRGPMVFDITIPSEPRYCFVDVEDLSVSWRYVGPISLVDYISKHDIPLSLSRQEAMERSQRFAVIDREALLNAWPHLDWAFTTQPMEEDEDNTNVPSLAHLAVKAFVNHVLQTNECDDSIPEHFISVTNNQKTLREYLTRNAEEVQVHGAIVPLLRAAFAQTTHVNLTSWTDLSVDDLRAILEYKHVSSHAEVVSVSSTLSRDAVESLVKALPARGIEDLYIHGLGQTNQPPLTNAAIYRALRPKVRGRIVIDTAFVNGLRGWLECQPSKTIEFPTTDCSLLQILYGLHGKFDTIFLGDAMLTPIRLVSGLFSMLRTWLKDDPYVSSHHYSMTAAHAFASAPSSLEDTSQIEVSYRPKDAHQRSRDAGFQYVIRHLQQGTWTVLINVERLDSPSRRNAIRFRVAFVKAHRDTEATRESAEQLGPEDIAVVDIEGFLRATAPGVEIGGLSALEKSLNELAEKMYGAPEDAHSTSTGESVLHSFTVDEAYEFIKHAFSWEARGIMVRVEL
ncbi:hypothetical protein SLS62_002286 [Diatrype stigma]|uniref:Uncharacterized protein n=1 Tax=Diatrype stigma TaxID=117547 RepID=A0AAN9YVT1_9PEZI